MADRDLRDAGAYPKELQDPDHVHAPLAQAVAAVPKADDITRARHLRIALEAFAAETSTSNPPSPHRWHRRLRLSTSIGAVAAAALMVVGLGVVVSLLNTQGNDDADLTAVEASAQPYDSADDSSPNETEMMARSTESMMLVLTPCTEEISEVLRAEEAGDYWSVDEVTEGGAVVLRVEAFRTNATESPQVPTMTLFLDPDNCRILRTERAAP
jgi:hypothetical protein